jgi:hypothetical protein
VFVRVVLDFFNQDCEIVEQDCESSEWVELKEGTFKECEDYQKKDEAKQLEYGISVDYKKREKFLSSSQPKNIK